MPIEILLYLAIALLLLCAAMLAVLLRRGAHPLEAGLAAAGAGQERTERAVRD